ncbi:MAG: hypothetical protein EOP92_25455 [Lysobacteraceae bacterium]|nr:MAG: hypothetical protein EOP92_25455 [Xanthomonadaceae bacterium]
MDNTLEEHGTIAPGQPLLLRTVLRLLPPSSSGALRCVLETTGSAEGAPVFGCASTYLIRRGKRGSAKQSDAKTLPPWPPVAQWTLDAAAGRRYARLSGDWNPIHLTGGSARLMGMRAPIIHGMHTAASSCAALEGNSGKHTTRIACRFQAAVALGSTVSLYRKPGTDEFVVEAGGTRAVSGEWTVGNIYSPKI